MSSAPDNLGGQLKEWVNSLRFGWFTLLFFTIFVLGIIGLSDTLGVYVQQQQEIQDSRTALAEVQKRVDAETKNLADWQDPEYIKTQARDRLFYVLPGESQLAVIKDVELPAPAPQKNSAELTQARQQWTNNLLASLLVAGATPVTATVDDPPPTQQDPAAGQTGGETVDPAAQPDGDETADPAATTLDEEAENQ